MLRLDHLRRRRHRRRGRRGAIACKFRNSGQTCVCTNRIYVQERVYDKFAKKFAAAVAKLKVGRARRRHRAGPADRAGRGRQGRAPRRRREEHGAKVLTGGKRHALGGLFYEPTVLADCTPDMLISHEETFFGPVAPLLRFKDEDEVIGLANKTEYGLASYFYARDVGRCSRLPRRSRPASSRSTRASSRPRSRRSAATSTPASAARLRYGIDEYPEIKHGQPRRALSPPGSRATWDRLLPWPGLRLATLLRGSMGRGWRPGSAAVGEPAAPR